MLQAFRQVSSVGSLHLGLIALAASHGPFQLQIHSQAAIPKQNLLSSKYSHAAVTERWARKGTNLRFLPCNCHVTGRKRAQAARCRYRLAGGHSVNHRVSCST